MSEEPELEPTHDGSVTLADGVRTRVVAYASRVLGRMPDEEVPPGLKRFARWTPGKRERLAVRELAAAVGNDPVFRQRVGAVAAEAGAGLLAALEAEPGVLPAQADPAEAGALAYLVRPVAWEQVVAAAGDALHEHATRTSSEAAGEAVARLEAHLADARSALREEQQRRRTEVEAARAEIAELRRELRETKGAARRGEEAAATARQGLDQVRVEAANADKRAQGELRKLRQRLSTAESANEATRKARREERNLDDMRARLLLDTIVEAASGLSRELALPPVDVRPADLVGETGSGAAPGVTERAMSARDPALLERLILIPRTHLIVDGYNVSKTGWESQSLEQQRTRLVSGLGSLAARTGVEVTCCFDGSAVSTRVPLAAPRSVRVRFSAPGTIADELIRDLVRAEPQGRPVVVVSSDREVAESVREMGARPVASVALLRLLDRG